MRHLGLTPLDEHSAIEESLDQLALIVRENCDFERILDLLKGQPSLAAPPLSIPCPEGDGPVTVGIIRDSAFQFYYPENLEALERCGAELLFLDATMDQRLPELDALYIGGGFPETNAQRLSANTAFMAQIKARIEAGLPTYAECGGIMYLGTSVTWQGRRYPMTGAVGWGFVMERRPVGHGYCRMEVVDRNPFYPMGQEVVGHEFHYSRPVLEDGEKAGRFSCEVRRGHGFGQGREGLVYKGLFGTYNHVHAAATPQWARGLVAEARRFRLGR